MSFTIGENYLIKALDAYPYNMDEVCESLNYALSYDEDCDKAWCLHGKVMANYLKDYASAEESLMRSLSINPQHMEALIELMWLYLGQDRLDELDRCLQEFKKIRGADQALAYRFESILHERNNRLSESIESIKTARTYTYNKAFDDFLVEERNRLKAKRKRWIKKEKRKIEKKI